MVKKLKRLLIKICLFLLLAPVVLIGVFKFIDPPIWGWKIARMVAPPASYPSRTEHQWVPLDRIATSMSVAVMASEDQKFPYHHGVDTQALLDVILSADDQGPSRGASTITQQTAKNVFLFPAHSYLRKAYELYFALWMEVIWGKQRIMEVYLNVIEFGPGIYGVQAASEHYFHVPASRLTRSQAAQLAVVLPNPYRIKASPMTQYTYQRSRWVMRQMNNLGSLQW
ncbi:MULTISPECIES: monofunctional biosynthetic peptidoglycan transglycosylase [unclassified Vibrio]|uniref:monofunctional biosynthetic peptidoglycan transglycosylase n=1 Tax=unclassified Vibrio TaxID=2614977 RepID=UPI0013617634|nr:MULTISPECIES: monofunctional biosynthetic peptidoglycan transglycosylase [unclassified Vibrio]NAW59843.1 monofunctional biosynthetic peptidoglycan transglycosylase [Vibrio sp. V36_P2S2PM302]NAX27648.1 monofunctional biosynthetic peptidoglycan transglycosylase [Vibrio sp. V38_P2S17PM301]NAX30057.1 monofunctional biosynthetic peptidoglycan transglycosylase [Vibrio sp. V37_P2S8PM304]